MVVSLHFPLFHEKYRLENSVSGNRICNLQLKNVYLRANNMVRLELVQLNHRLGLAGVHVAGPCGAVER